MLYKLFTFHLSELALLPFFALAPFRDSVPAQEGVGLFRDHEHACQGVKRVLADAHELALEFCAVLDSEAVKLGRKIVGLYSFVQKRGYLAH